MILNINVKQIGKRRQKISTVQIEYKDDIFTIGEFIEETVKIMIAQFKQRVELSKLNNNLEPYSTEKIDDLIEIGKVSFGIINNEKILDERKAIDIALQAFEDGLVRIFVNDEEVGKDDLDIRNMDINNPNLRQTEKIHLSSGDTVTFIRMTFLAGRMF